MERPARVINVRMTSVDFELIKPPGDMWQNRVRHKHTFDSAIFVTASMINLTA